MNDFLHLDIISFQHVSLSRTKAYNILDLS